jgi:hypothetical protein
MITGSCHCGAVNYEFDGVPEGATSCNCTVCRRYGVLWAYDFEGEGIRIKAKPNALTAYMRGDKGLAFHFCRTCGCVSHWRGRSLDSKGRRRIAVNLRLAEPEAVAAIPMHRFDGLDTWSDLPQDGRCVADFWF